MIQSLNQKSSEKMKKRKKTQKCHRVQPPQLEQPGAGRCLVSAVCVVFFMQLTFCGNYSELCYLSSAILVMLLYLDSLLVLV